MQQSKVEVNIDLPNFEDRRENEYKSELVSQEDTWNI